MAEPPIAIRPAHWELVARILRGYVPGREVWAFGSRATGRAKAHSDLDLAVIGAAPMSLDLSAGLAEAFSESDLPFRVDVVDWATTSASFRNIIERDKVVVQLASSVESGQGAEPPLAASKDRVH